ncbi:cytochrome o ubiquinol oxidase subunit IV [Falsirhodobacter sp. 20TX0035]|uniref:cytochrome o ubiquinol oxidase subunit IV n=1 Tax=Falsirhodobacter sp. 20TX0035 TaxID=3022019 RepID=UPI00232EC6CA|nr:cytochrome C oxidase subunit IV family protein [Falsirhodobacter sp. 20TX0035]MDB6454024.1 cytochrome C oxidase subunit IV family protein [Falsirhodobacter sp. 20TX0035]
MNRRQERRSYIVGYVLALALTLPVFALLAFDLLPRRQILWIAGVAAAVQIAVHFRFFLHIRLKGQTREDLQLILFTTLLLILMGGGTIWIMTNLAHRM